MSGDIELRLFGALHLDRPSKVRAELDESADGVDAILVELPYREMTPRTVASFLLRTPAFFLGMATSVLLVATVTLLAAEGRVSAETLAVERVADDRDVPVHRVDDHPVQMAARAGPRWMVPNWALVLGLTVGWPVATATTAAALLAGSVAVAGLFRVDTVVARVAAALVGWGVLIGGLLSGVVFWLALIAFVLTNSVAILRTIGPRNEYMLERIEEITAEEGYDSGCLVTGRTHLRGLAAGAAERGVSVGRVHASKFCRRSDADWDDPDPDELPGVGRSGRRDGGESSRPQPDFGTERGALSARAVAAVLDLAGMAVVSPLAGIAVGVVTALAGFGDAAIGVSVVAGALVGLVLYAAVSEGAFGRTPGKALVGLVVVSTDGSPCSWRAAVVRNLLRPVDLLGGALAVAFTLRHRRLGDLAAGTVVCRTAGENG